MESTSKTARRMRARTTAIAALTLALALGSQATASAGAPSVKLMVTGKNGILRSPVTVSAAARAVQVAGRQCVLPQGTPLAALAAAGVSMHLKDFGSCSMNPADESGIYADQILGASGVGMAGWTFKVNNVSGTAGAANAGGPFGRGPLATGDLVLWFWCENYPCQRTLSITAPSTVRSGAQLRVRVLAHDDSGKSVWAKGATVRVAQSTAVTDSLGWTGVTAPSKAGTTWIYATDTTKPGGYTRAPAFPKGITVTGAG